MKKQGHTVKHFPFHSVCYACTVDFQDRKLGLGTFQEVIMKQTFNFSGHHDSSVKMLEDIIWHFSGKSTSRAANYIKAFYQSETLSETVVRVSLSINIQFYMPRHTHTHPCTSAQMHAHSKQTHSHKHTSAALLQSCPQN